MTVGEYVKSFRNGVYTLANIAADGRFAYQHCHIESPEFKNRIGEEDCFISMNPFVYDGESWRLSKNVKSFNMLYVDIDCYNVGLTKDGVLYELQEDYFGSLIPEPTFIVDSGQGLYLQWLLEGESDRGLWQTVTYNLVSLLKPFGADRACTDPARVMRLPHSINRKNGGEVKVIGGTYERVELEIFDVGYGLAEARDGRASALVENTALNSRKKTPVGASANCFAVVNSVCEAADSDYKYTLHAGRIADLYRIADGLKWDGDDSCKKEIMCFLMRYWLLKYGYNSEAALHHTLQFNKRFAKPLDERYVACRTKSAETAYKAKSRMYNYKNDTLVKLLGIEEAEKELGLKSIISTAEKNRRKGEANKAYYKKKQRKGSSKADKLKIRREAIMLLLLKGTTVKNICALLGISRRTYYSDFKAIKPKLVSLRKVSAENSAPKLYKYNLYTKVFSVPAASSVPVFLPFRFQPVSLWWREDSGGVTASTA